MRRARGGLSSGVVGLLFFASGAVALVVEQAFEKLLGLLVGTSTPASAVVLATYFGGLTLGAWLYASRFRRRVRNPMRAYALLEGGIAAWSLGLSLSFGALVPLFAPLLRQGADAFWLLQVLRGAVACAWIVPPTLLMGATFPAVVDALEAGLARNRGRAIASVYAMNLLGGLAGALAGPFLAFPAVGVDGALQVGALVDAGVAGVAWFSSRRLTEAGLIARAAKADDPPATPRLLVGIAALSGFLFFTLEVVFTHLIGAVLGNSVFAFAAMLSVVLLGLFLGGLLSARLMRSRESLPASVPGLLFLAGSLALAITFDFWPAVPHSLARLGGGLESFGAGEALRWAHAAALLLPGVTLLGMAFPALFRLDLFPAERWASVAGRLSAANSLGCIAGAFAGGFVLLPVIGSEASLRLVSALYAVAGLSLVFKHASGIRRLAYLVPGAAVLALGASRPAWDQLALTSGEHVYFQRRHVTPESKLLSFHEDAGGITTVVENPSDTGSGGRTRTLLTNGKFQGNDGGESEAQVGFALVPILHASRFDDALVIGLGTGHSAAVVVSLGYGSVDVAEIAPGIVEAARTGFARLNGRLLERPAVRLHLEDGRNVLLLREKRYDLITMEISSVWFVGATNLYSREFYRLAASRLAPGGVFQQWIQIHHLASEELRTVIASARNAFPFVSFWVVGGQGILVCTSEPQVLRAEALRRLEAAGDSLGWPRPELAARLRGLLASRLLAAADVAKMTETERPHLNTDANRRLEYRTPRENLSRLPWGTINLNGLALYSSPPRFEVEPTAAPLGDVARSVSRADQVRVLGIRERFIRNP